MVQICIPLDLMNCDTSIRSCLVYTELIKWGTILTFMLISFLDFKVKPRAFLTDQIVKGEEILKQVF